MRRTRLTAEAIEAFTPDVKVGLLATLDPRGLPHVSLITSLTAKGEGALMFGQFTEGRSKLHVRQDPRVGFLVLSMDRRMWRGKARWTAATREGEDHLAFNARSMFRYNAYFGVHTVHHLELVAVSERMRVPLPSMLAGGLRARLVRPSLGAGRPEVFNAWTRRHLQGLTTLKFLCFADADGYPRLVP
ncbi:MAG TPA: pyridoxamine 5'-phosphate oxidase family protein, partial [Myxococcota bacterium]|nr:pyridoxamine 5'-phosphate oxidase family protein [Myxococcota bacterium]